MLALVVLCAGITSAAVLFVETTLQPWDGAAAVLMLTGLLTAYLIRLAVHGERHGAVGLPTHGGQRSAGNGT